MSILWGALRTKPEILFNVTVLATRAKYGTLQDFSDALSVLRYISSCKEDGVRLKTTGKVRTTAWVDSSANIHPDMRGQNGHVISIGDGGYGGPVEVSSCRCRYSASSTATYELYAGYQKLIGRMFGSFIEFNWNPTKHMLTLLQRPFATGEQVMLKTQNYRPDFVLLQDIYAKQWLYDYTLAVCKLMLGEARSKFGQIAGPSSGIQLNGAALKTEGTTEITQLEKDIGDMIPGGTPMTFVIG
jgi:hypothetical protein